MRKSKELYRYSYSHRYEDGTETTTVYAFHQDGKVRRKYSYTTNAGRKHVDDWKVAKPKEDVQHFVDGLKKLGFTRRK